jgi:hypothetical protein
MQLRESEPMDEDKDKKYIIRPVTKEEPETSLENEGTSESTPAVQATPTTQQAKPWQKNPFSQIPTDKIFKTMTNKDMMKQTFQDETMEPHRHMVYLLTIVMIMAIIISLLGF